MFAILFNLSASELKEDNKRSDNMRKVYCSCDDIIINNAGIFIDTGGIDPLIKVSAIYFDEAGFYVAPDEIDTLKIRFCQNGHIYLSKYSCCLGTKECPYSCINKLKND